MNIRLKTYTLLLVLFFGALVNCYSQTDEVVLGLRAGHNAVFGAFFAPSVGCKAAGEGEKPCVKRLFGIF